MLPRYFFWMLLLLICGYALLRGRGDERIAAGVCLLASLATRFAISPLSVRYSGVETGLLVVDGLVLAMFIVLALRSERFWPLWVAGLQLTSSMAHLMKLVEIDLVPRVYGAAAVFWSYPILIILAVGTWRGHRRRMRDREFTATHA